MHNLDPYLKASKNNYFEKSVLTIDSLYLKSTAIEFLRVNFNEPKPSWLNYKFMGTNLVFYGEYPINTNNMKFLFVLFDSKNKKSSEIITIFNTPILMK